MPQLPFKDLLLGVHNFFERNEIGLQAEVLKQNRNNIFLEQVPKIIDEKPSTHCPLSTFVSRDSNVMVSCRSTLGWLSYFLHLIYVIEKVPRLLYGKF